MLFLCELRELCERTVFHTGIKNRKMDVKIEVDYREKPSGIIDILRSRNGIRVEEKRLSVGDYRINDHITVERKTTRNFIISIIDGRLFSQAAHPPGVSANRAKDGKQDA